MKLDKLCSLLHFQIRGSYTKVNFIRKVKRNVKNVQLFNQYLCTMQLTNSHAIKSTIIDCRFYVFHLTWCPLLTFLHVEYKARWEMKKSMSYWHFVQERIIHAYLMYKIETRTFLYVQKKAPLKFKSGNEYNC